MNYKVQILMSTYNGEKYLREQIDSIVKQKGNFEKKILVRDDGSTDNTIDILKEFSNRIIIDVIRGENIGVNASFKELFMNSDLDFDYFAISDQDDFWLENKLEIAINKLIEDKTEGIKVFASRSYVTDENMNVLGKTQDSQGKVSFYNAMVQNLCPGHTQVLNKQAILELRNTYNEKIFVIDWWIYLLATGMGKLLFERECTVKHRQHGVNTVGYELNFFKKLIKRIKYLHKHQKSPVSEQLKNFYNIYNPRLKSEYKEEINNFFVNQSSVFKRIRYIINSKVFRYGIFENIIFKILYIIGKYKI